MNTIVEHPPGVEEVYDKKLLLGDLKLEIAKTQKSIFIIGGIFLISDLLALSEANLLNGNNVVYVLLVPLFYAGLGFLAKFKPLLATILATLLFVGIISMSMVAFGATSIIKGLLLKLLIIYFILVGFRNAIAAEETRKKLELFR